MSRPDSTSATENTVDRGGPASTRAVGRRGFLRLAAGAGVALPLAGSLAACAASGSSGSTNAGPTGQVGADNPFGMAQDSTVDAVVFDGGYGTDYVTNAGSIFSKLHSGSKVTVTGSTQIAQQMQPRFVGGNPPDLLDNSGANAIGLSAIAAELEDLGSLVDADNLAGTKIRDTLYPGVLDVGMYNGKLAAMNYVLTVYGVWYSKSLFDANGWSPPKTWDEAMELGAQARSKGKYLFTWGKEAASYYLTLAVDSAIKQGGDDVRVSMDNLAADAWSAGPVQQVLTAMAGVVSAGYMRPGGAGTQFTAAQAQWSQAEEALLYPCGSWIENEMKSQTRQGFTMTGVPTPTVTADPALAYEAIRSTPNEPYVVPSRAKNSAGGKELLRVMLSKEAATEFARTRLASTIVRDTVPKDAFGSTALASQISMLDAAGDKAFSWNFVSTYGMTAEVNVLWNSFLSGQSGVGQLTSGMQALFDKIRTDDSITKVKVS